MSFIEIANEAWWTTAQAWRCTKDAIELSGVADNALLHIIAGVLIFGAILAISRQPWRWLASWTVTLAAVLWNELVDLTVERWPDITEQLAEGCFDLAVTMSMPTLLWALSAWSRRSLSPEISAAHEATLI